MKINSDLIFSSNGTSIDKMESNITNLQAKVLWTNPNPTLNVDDGYVINLNSNDYDYLGFFINQTRDSINPQRCLEYRVLKGSTLVAFLPHTGVTTGTNLTRNIVYNSDTKYTCQYVWVRGGSESDANRFLIPIKVVGYKFN